MGVKNPCSEMVSIATDNKDKLSKSQVARAHVLSALENVISRNWEKPDQLVKLGLCFKESLVERESELNKVRGLTGVVQISVATIHLQFLFDAAAELVRIQSSYFFHGLDKSLSEDIINRAKQRINGTEAAVGTSVDAVLKPFQTTLNELRRI